MDARSVAERSAIGRVVCFSGRCGHGIRFRSGFFEVGDDSFVFVAHCGENVDEVYLHPKWLLRLRILFLLRLRIDLALERIRQRAKASGRFPVVTAGHHENFNTQYT